jgi:hypothetical protein
MASFAFLPIAVLGAVALAVCTVLVFVERAERRRARIHAAARQRVEFRLVVIEGGRSAVVSAQWPVVSRAVSGHIRHALTTGD